MSITLNHHPEYIAISLKQIKGFLDRYPLSFIFDMENGTVVIFGGEDAVIAVDTNPELCASISTLQHSSIAFSNNPSMGLDYRLVEYSVGATITPLLGPQVRLGRLSIPRMISDTRNVYNRLVGLGCFNLKSGIRTISTLSNIFKTFQAIESHGVYVDGVGISPTEINSFTMTGRPAMKCQYFGNLMALPKEKKRMITSRYGKHGKIITIDMLAFHLQLLKKMFGEPITCDPYLALADANNLGDREEGKTFYLQNAYGYSDVWKRTHLGKQQHDLRAKIHSDFIENGYVETFSGRRFTPITLGDNSDGKLFAQWMQSLETETFVGLIHTWLQQSLPSEIHPFLYQFDSISIDTLDIHAPVVVASLRDVVNAAKLAVRITVGSTLNEQNYQKVFYPNHENNAKITCN